MPVRSLTTKPVNFDNLNSERQEMKIERFEDIEAWQLARDLARYLYDLTRRVKFTRDLGLKRQIRHASGAAMHNIAQGFDAGSDPEYIRFLRRAKRACTEVQSQLYIALDQKYISVSDFVTIHNHAGRTRAAIGGLIRELLNHAQEATQKEKIEP